MTKQAVLNPGMGARAKARRIALGLSASQVSEELGVTVRRLYQMEQDGVDGLATSTRWADALNMRAVELCFGIKSKKERE